MFSILNDLLDKDHVVILCGPGVSPEVVVSIFVVGTGEGAHGTLDTLCLVNSRHVPVVEVLEEKIQHKQLSCVKFEEQLPESWP